ncbi:MAG: GatB/YqeY domain-containing protein [Calditrichaceae bacterium]
MALDAKIHKDMQTALKEGRKFELSTLRTVFAQIKDERIRLKAELTDEDVIRVLSSAVKKRRDSSEMYKQGNRQDLADKELQEISIIEKYLPEQLSEDKIEEILTSIIAESGAVSVKDMGKVMGLAMNRLKGAADGKIVQNLVRKLLSIQE